LIAAEHEGGRATRATFVALLLRYLVSYLIGIALAGSITSISGGSALLLILYSLTVGFPFFLIALILGLVFRRSVAAHPLPWSLAAPAATALIWCSLDLTTGDLFNPHRLVLYATFCAAACAGVFFATTRFWPFR
jgi:thiamine transporter ThiT